MQSDKTNNIWERYCHDFLSHKLHIKEENALTVSVLEAYVQTVDRVDPSSSSLMVSLHVHIEKHRLKLPQLVQILRPISKFQMSDLETTIHLTKSKLTLTQLLSITSVRPLSLSKKSIELAPDVYTLIVFLLFEFLCSRAKAIEEHTLNVSEMSNWCTSYQDIVRQSSPIILGYYVFLILLQMLMPGVLEGIMKNLTVEIEEAKLNTMHMTYLAIECSSERRPTCGLKVFNDLYSEYFGESKVCE